MVRRESSAGSLVQADEQVDQLAADRLTPSMTGNSDNSTNECAYSPGQVIIGSVDDSVDTMISLARLMQQTTICSSASVM